MFDRIGVCSWSLQPASMTDLIEKVRRTGLTCTQIALEPFRADPAAWPLRRVESEFAKAGLTIASAMMSTKGEDYSSIQSIERTGGVRPDAAWRDNLAAAERDAEAADVLGVPLVTFHAGFIPHDNSHPEWRTLRDRVLRVADCFAKFDISVALETGQEPSRVLVEFLEEIDNPMIGVNFDPANILLYANGDPVEAFRRVAPFVDQIHIKDADPSRIQGQWGTEVVVGAGSVDWRSLLDAIREENFSGDAMIEREAGETRVADIERAREFLNAAIADTKRNGG